MRIAFLSTRISGSDGVSLEVEKWASILGGSGYEIFYCAGELADQPNQVLIPEMHFTHPAIQQVQDLAFGINDSGPAIIACIEDIANLLRKKVEQFLDDKHIDLIIAENILTIPMNIPLGVAVTQIIKERNLPALAHHHDFYWERERFLKCNVPGILEEFFPPSLPTLAHIVISSLAREMLEKRKGIEAEIIPNIFNFRENSMASKYSVHEIRSMLGIRSDEIMVLQPTRIIPRKGIEHAIDLVAELRKPSCLEKLSGRPSKLVISHPSGDEGDEYLTMLTRKAQDLGVPMVLADQVFRKDSTTSMEYLWDIYRSADLVTYPSSVEGFGNALLEAIYFHKPIVINRYPVYDADIRPLGFELFEMAGDVTENLVESVIAVLNDPERIKEISENNFQIAKNHFSYEVVKPKLDKMIGNVLK